MLLDCLITAGWFLSSSVCWTCVHGFQKEFQILMCLTTGQFSILPQIILNELRLEIAALLDHVHKWPLLKADLFFCVCTASMSSLAFLLVRYCLRRSVITPTTSRRWCGFFFCSAVARADMLLFVYFLFRSDSATEQIKYILCKLELINVEHQMLSFYRYCRKLSYLPEMKMTKKKNKNSVSQDDQNSRSAKFIWGLM